MDRPLKERHTEPYTELPPGISELKDPTEFTSGLNAELIGKLAIHFLSPSQSFESYVPNSHQNISNNLAILGHLGKVTQESFPATPPEPVLSQESNESAATSAGQPGRPVSRTPQVAEPASTLSTAAPTTRLPSAAHLTRNKEYRQALNDTQVIEALLNLKNSRSALNK